MLLKEFVLLIIDDHPLIQVALRDALLKSCPGMTVHCAGSLEQGLALARSDARIDLVLLDLTLPGYQGLAALWTFREQAPLLPVAVFSALCDGNRIRSALDSGAIGFVPKHSSPALILQALSLMLAGGTYVPMEALGGSDTEATSAGHSRPGRDLQALPTRQREVAYMVARGMSNKEICRQLNLSPNTVKSHLASIFETLKVHSRYEIFALARTFGPAQDADFGTKVLVSANPGHSGGLRFSN